jgi:hypothetical protein
VLILGGLLVGTVALRIRDRDLRLPVAVVGGSLVVVVALVVYRPLTQAEKLAFVPDGAGARATYVSTGLLPVRLSADGADPVVLADGEVGSVLTRHATGVEAGRQFTVSIRPAVPWTWWLVLIAGCFVPCVTVAVRRRDDQPGSGLVAAA